MCSILAIFFKPSKKNVNNISSRIIFHLLPFSKTKVLWKTFSVLVTQLCLTLCNPMDCSSPGSSVHRILQARILEWVTILTTPFSRGSLPLRDRNWVSHIAGRFSEPPEKPQSLDTQYYRML